MITLLEKLEKALGYGGGNAEASRHGSQLLERLSRPVQVAVVGPAESGKSSLIDMILGRRVLGSHKGQPRIEVVFGSEETVFLGERDEPGMEVAGVVSRHADLPRSSRIRQALPVEQLNRFNILEIPLVGSLDDKAASVREMTSRADIILWCTEGFGDDEQRLWATVPEVQKDHSFLVVTKADQHLMRGTLSNLMARLEQVAINEFLGIFPVASLRALAARSKANGGDPKLWASSGGRQIHDALMHQVDMGRSADVDQAEVLLRQLAQPEKEVLQQPLLVQTRERAGGSAAAGPESETLLKQALDLLQERGSAMLQQVNAQGKTDTETLLSQCVETALGISEIFGHGVPDSPVLDAARRDAAAAEELVLLMQVERRDESAIDAVKLLLQLKNEFHEYLEASEETPKQKVVAQK